MEACEDLLPPYLRFVRGVVDSADLPLNVSRETLQQDRHIVQIRKWITGKLLKTLEKMRDERRDDYLKLWREFGRILKEGVTTESEHRDRLTQLFLFASSNDGAAVTSLAEYVTRMKDGQDEIFYLTGESRAAIESSPHLEAFAARGYEVLYLDDPVDEILVQFVTEHDSKRLRSVAKGDVDLGSESERKEARAQLDEQKKELGDLLAVVAKHLGEHVKEVRLSSRLTTSPACLVGSEHDLSPQLERLLRHSHQEVPKQKRILELNPGHPVVKRLAERFAADAVDPEVATTARLLHGYAVLAEGSQLPDPTGFNHLLVELMARTV